MNIFIAGPRAMRSVNEKVANRINDIIAKEYTVLIGDANGMDKAIQSYLFDKKYKNVKVYASNGNARNNIGNWVIEKVEVPSNVKGFEFYAAKDLKMAEDSDCGFMIWDGKSKGTLNNSINLLTMKKKVILFFAPEKVLYDIDSLNGLENFIKKCDLDTQLLYSDLVNNKNTQLKIDL